MNGWRTVLFFTFLVASLNACGQSEEASSRQEPRTPDRKSPNTGSLRAKRLLPGSSFEAALTSGRRQSFLVALTPGQALRLTVNQRDIDLVVEVIDPEGHSALEVDSPIGNRGPEEVCFVADRQGFHRIGVRPLGKGQVGRYAMRVGPLGQATEADRKCMKAIRAFAEAERRWQDAARTGTIAPGLIHEYEVTLDLWRQSGQLFQEAFTLGQMGQHWSDLGYVSKAVNCYSEAASKMQSAGDRWQEVVLLNQLGAELRLLGELPRAESSLQAALLLARELKDRSGEATALNNLAVLAKTRGEVLQAIDSYHQARNLYRALDEPAAEAVTLHNLGVSYSLLGRYQEALDVLGDALEIQRHLQRKAAEAATLTAIGWAQYLAGDSGAAISSYKESLALSRGTGRRSLEAAALDRMASAYRKKGQLAKALVNYRAALTIAEELGNRRDIAHTLTNLGWLLQEQGHFRAARRELEQAVALQRRIEDREGLAYALVGLARSEHGLGRDSAALQRMEEALGLVEKLRAFALRQGAQPQADPFWQDYTEFYIDLLMHLHRANPNSGFGRRAFEVSDLAQARSLVGLLEESRLGLRSGVPATLLDQERRVQGRLNALEESRSALLAMEKPLNRELALLDRSLREAHLAYQDLQRAIRTSSPRFAKLRNPEAIALPKVQRMLDAETLLLSYVLGEEGSFLFLVGTDSFEYRPLPRRDRIEALAKAVYEGFRENRLDASRSQVQLAASELSALLLPTAARKPGKRRLLIVADGMLHYIPFAAFPVPGESTDPQSVLIDRYQLVYLPSTVALEELRRRQAERGSKVSASDTKRLGLVADPVFSRHDVRLAAAAGRARKNQRAVPAVGPVFPRLPFTRREAESILRMVPPTQRLVALDFAANKVWVSSGALSHCAIVHFATHAVINEDHPELSEVVLSMVDAEGHLRDGHLRLHEIYTLQLPADLVVLSACRSALGQRIRGDGLVGLTRGFTYAGASRLVVSLWDVNDAATAELMARFYRGVLQQGMSPALALHEAQRWLRGQRRWQAPYYWAPFVLQGDWR